MTGPFKPPPDLDLRSWAAGQLDAELERQRRERAARRKAAEAGRKGGRAGHGDPTAFDDEFRELLLRAPFASRRAAARYILRACPDGRDDWPGLTKITEILKRLNLPD